MSKKLTSSEKLKIAIKKVQEYDKNPLKVTYSEFVTLKHDFYKIDNYSLNNEELFVVITTADKIKATATPHKTKDITDAPFLVLNMNTPP